MDLIVQKFPFTSSKFSKWWKVRYQEKRGKEENVFKEYLFLFLFSLLWSGSGTSRKVVSRADVTSLPYLCASLGLFCPHWLGSQKPRVFLSLHRLQIRHSKILLILARPLPIGYFTFYYFSFFWFLTGWMRGAYAWRCVYTFCMWQPTSQHPVGSFIVNS